MMLFAQRDCVAKQPPLRSDRETTLLSRQDPYIFNGKTTSFCSVRSYNAGHGEPTPRLDTSDDSHQHSILLTHSVTPRREKSVFTSNENLSAFAPLENPLFERPEDTGSDRHGPSCSKAYVSGDRSSVDHSSGAGVDRRFEKGYRVLLDPITGDVEALVSPRAALGLLASHKRACGLEVLDTHRVGGAATDAKKMNSPRRSSGTPSLRFADLCWNTDVGTARWVCHTPGGDDACREQTFAECSTSKTTAKEKDPPAISDPLSNAVSIRLKKSDSRKADVEDVKHIVRTCGTTLQTDADHMSNKTDRSEKNSPRTFSHRARPDSFKAHLQQGSCNRCPTGPVAHTSSQALPAELLRTRGRYVKSQKGCAGLTMAQCQTLTEERIRQRSLEKLRYRSPRLPSAASSARTSSTRAPSSTQDCLRPSWDDAGSVVSPLQSVMSSHPHLSTLDSTQSLLDYIPDPFTAGEILWHSSNAFYQAQQGHRPNEIFTRNQKQRDTRPSLGNYLGTLFEEWRRADPLMDLKGPSSCRRFHAATEPGVSDNVFHPTRAPVFGFPHRSHTSAGTSVHLLQRSKGARVEAAYPLKNKPDSSMPLPVKSNRQTSANLRRLNDALQSECLTSSVDVLPSPRRPEIHFLRNLSGCFCSEAC